MINFISLMFFLIKVALILFFCYVCTSILFEVCLYLCTDNLSKIKRVYNELDSYTFTSSRHPLGHKRWKELGGQIYAKENNKIRAFTDVKGDWSFIADGFHIHGNGCKYMGFLSYYWHWKYKKWFKENTRY